MDNPEENNIVSGYQHISSDRNTQAPVSYPASQVWRTATERRKTRYPEYPHPDEDACIHISDISPAFLLQRRSHRTHRSNRPESGVPTTADGDTPVTDVLQPVQVRLVKTLRHKFQFSIVKSLDGRLLPFPPSLQTTVV